LLGAARFCSSQQAGPDEDYYEFRRKSPAVLDAAWGLPAVLTCHAVGHSRSAAGIGSRCRTIIATCRAAATLRHTDRLAARSGGASAGPSFTADHET
jgi:hypothetical protein